MPPEIEKSTVEERAAYIREKYHCISDCDNCGLCQMFRGKDPEVAFADYIDGKSDYLEVIQRYR